MTTTTEPAATTIPEEAPPAAASTGEAQAPAATTPPAASSPSQAQPGTSARTTPWGLLAVAVLIALAAGAAAMFGIQRYFAGRDTAAPGGSGASAAATGQPDSMTGMDMGASGTTGHPTEVKGNVVYISPARQQLIGVRTATVTHRVLDTTIRTVGTVAYDETRVTHIHTKIAGWVDRLYVDYVGKQVQKGEPLFTVYSPDLVSTQREYLLALKARGQLADSQFEETRAGAASLVNAARERLKLWDISDEQIAELERTGEPRRTLTLYSPFTGIVLERETYAGQYITPDMKTFKIADLSTIWVLGQVFEYELQNIRIGQEAQIEFPYGQSTKTLRGKVTFIYPEIDPQTRRATVRIEFRNPGLEFKPETYVTVNLKSAQGHRLAVPKEAVIDTGTSQYAILAHPNGYFEPREVRVGTPVDAYYPVVSGLADSDQVVTSAQFLIDSETNLQAAMQSMVGHGHGGGAAGPSQPPPGSPAPPAPPAADHSQHQPAVDHSQHKQ